MLSIPREKYPEMNWRAADKVAAWKVFKQQMEVISGSGPSYLWQEAMKLTTAGTLLKIQSRTVR